MTQVPPRILPTDSVNPGTPGRGDSLADRLAAGEEFAITFGGQGTDWSATLAELLQEGGNAARAAELVTASTRLVAPVAAELAAALPRPFEPHLWSREDAPDTRGTGEPLAVGLDIPGVLLTQLTALDLLAAEGLDLTRVAPAAAAGHSQGILGVAAFAGRKEGPADSDAQLLALARLIGAASAIVGRRAGLVAHGEETPMVSVAGASLAEVEELLADITWNGSRAVVAAVNGPRRVVVSGSAEALGRFRAAVAARSDREAAEIERKSRGGRAFAPVLESVPVGVGFHHPDLAPAVDLVSDWAARCGLDADLAENLARAICVETVDWPRELRDAVGPHTAYVVDLGPAELSANMTARALRGRGVTVVPAATTAGRDLLLTPGAEVRRAADWSAYAPRLVDRGDGKPVVDTAFTRLTGKSPILLAGMTPTTVDPAIVAAAANAGHWAELAGGGQVTEQIFADNVARLGELLDEGATAQFNTLFLDPYLWKMQVGGQRLVQKARQAGAPLDGLVISAGVPETEDALAIVEDLRASGISHVAFKPGTVKQIRQVLAIARETDVPVIAHIEGGVAGGHHSWEDLDELLLATYADLRSVPNLVVCVGGGIGTPERAVDYLRGTWATAHGEAAMPVDGVLLGTVTMAVKEATTSDAVKDLLVSTPGVTLDDNGGWVGAGRSAGEVTSGRSQLGADIHEIDNAASRCGALLDQVAGDLEAALARKDELVAAMAPTAKPYFGDVAEMTYEQLLRRYLELAGPRAAEAEGTTTGSAAWLDVTLRTRFEELLDRTLARVVPETSGEVERPYDLADVATAPAAALDALVAAHPQATACVLHPADVAFFVEVCRRPGKPVTFVPVIDADVRRWWRSDSLWQAHDAAYDAEQVIVIPGPVAVAGITVKDEPVAELMDRFEAAVVADLTASEAAVLRGVARTTVGDDTTLLDAARDARDVVWAGRVVDNPLRRLVGTEAALEEGGSAGTAVLRVPLTHGELVLPVDLSGVATGGLPVIGDDAVTAAMGDLLAVTAGGTLPEVRDDSASTTVAWSRDLVADHVGVTDPARRRRGETDPDPRADVVPDALVGLAWPAVFACIGPVEGLLDLVHLDHRVSVLSTLADLADGTELTLRATRTGVVDSVAGQVISVDVTVHAGDDLLAELAERFMVRGRTGSAALADPAALAPEADDRPRARLDRFTVTAPRHMGAFAAVSGDHNPLHTDVPAARLAGFDGPIVHGMWTSAVAQRAAASAGATHHPRQVRSWLTRWVAPVLPGAEVEVTVERTGVLAGDSVLEVSVRTLGDEGGELAMVAQAVVAAPRTAYAFPGQGIQSPGMGLDARSRSAAARKVWDDADAHTRDALGFSILAVVRDNPTELWADGELHRHPDGVLFLTQFTQVAMATLAVAQVAEMRESGVFVEGAITCGHSVGEYNALAAVTGILPLEALLEIVFRRGMAMHHLVPRDAAGRSNYRLAAIRPSQIRLADDEVAPWVAEIAERTGEFIQIVNYNLRGSQYAIAGTVRGLEVLEEEVAERRARFGGKAAFILVPGIDVPFHSSELHAGVPEFRATLDSLLPETIDPSLLVGRYIPNLVPRLFSLDKEFVEEVAAYVDSPLLKPALKSWKTWSKDPSRLGRALLIELLAWQFASPVRWIETQDLLFGPVAPGVSGGLAVEQFVEVGVANAPTIANLASQTTKLPSYDGEAPRILNSSRDAAVVFATDTPVVEEEPEAEASEATPQAEAAPKAAPAAAPAGPTSAPGADRPADLAYTAADATTTLAALRTKVRPDQIGTADTIEALCDGVSSRRNQLLVDLGAELGLGAIDGAAEAPWTALGGNVSKLARGYSAFGPVLTEAVGDTLRKFAGSVGAKPAGIVDRVKDTWQLGPGWVSHVQAVLACGLRDGSSTRGGALGFDAQPTDLASAVDQAVRAVGAAQGVAISMPAGGDAGGATVDSAALDELADAITGPQGVLAATARQLLGKLGLDVEGVSLDVEDDLDAELVRLVESELGSDWAKKVAPSFDAQRAVLLDDRWASVREDLARAWAGDEDVATRSFAGLDANAQAQATWWLDRARTEKRKDLVTFYRRVLAAAETGSAYAGEVAVVTGAAPGSIAGSVVADLLRGGATVVATTSRLSKERLAYFRGLYRDHASTGAALWVLPANLASYADVDALVEWISSPVVDEAGGQRTELRPALSPTLVFPFAAPPVQGTAADAGPRAEVEFRVLVWGVERLVTGLAAQGAEHRLGQRVHVVLPGSPNRGRFGGDGSYGEAKAAFDAFVQRWHAETAWAARVSLAHAHIGWVRGTGLMGGNDPLVGAVEAAGVRTWSPEEMTAELLALCTPEVRAQAASTPVVKDLTGGLREADLDLAALARDARASMEAAAASSAVEADETTVTALTHPAGWAVAQPTMDWADIDAAPEDLVVIVGAGEVGPVGSARTRFEMEVEDHLSPAGVLELAWTTGRIVWEHQPKAGWHDAASGDPLTEAEVVEKYAEELEASVGIRRFRDDNQLVDGTAPLMVSVYLDEDTSFVVRTESEARAFAEADPQHTRIAPGEDGDWVVTRLAGGEMRVPRRFKLTRFVGAQVPDGFDPAVWGLGSMVESVDRLAAWNLIATVDAFVSSGVTPAELLRWVHPTQFANTQGTGIGGMQSTRRMYVDALLGEEPPNDVLQEALPNVVAAHTVQSYLGGYGAMVHPVAACATAAVSVEEGVDKIKLGKASVVVAGGFDDLGIEGILGFGNMSATADTAQMLGKGIEERHVCRPNDRRRGGFVEAQGGGTVVLARGDVAADLGLPVLGVVAYAASYADGIHTSIPAPGIGALGAGVGGTRSPLARSLATLGLGADDLAVVSKHDTSTAANDPNESQLHEKLADALGRTEGSPLYVVSQKSLTGHAKGGAAAFQLNGLCQLLAGGVVPPNRGLDCVDEQLAVNEHLVWLRQSLATGPLKAGVLTSLGFGHVSAMVVVAHPGAFVAALPADRRESWISEATARLVAGETRRIDAMHGGDALFVKAEKRRFASSDLADTKADESAMLVDPDARLGEDGVYARAAR